MKSSNRIYTLRLYIAEMRRRCGGDVKIGVDVVEMGEMWWRCGGDAGEMRGRCGGDGAGKRRVDVGVRRIGGRRGVGGV